VLDDVALFRQIEQLTRCEPITEEQVKKLCLKAREILVEEGNVQVVDSPITVCFPVCLESLVVLISIPDMRRYPWSIL
jgi:hypothetical protein